MQSLYSNQQPIDATRVHMNCSYGWINITGSNMWAPIHPQCDLISESHKMCRHPHKKDSLCLHRCANSIFITLFKNIHTLSRKQRAEGDCHLASDKQTASDEMFITPAPHVSSDPDLSCKTISSIASCRKHAKCITQVQQQGILHVHLLATYHF